MATQKYLKLAKKGVDKSTPLCYNQGTKEKEINAMKKIIIGTRLKDGWGNEWYVVSKDATGYNLHSCRFPTEEHFSYEEIKNNFKITSK